MASPAATPLPPGFTIPGSLYNGESSYGGRGPGVLTVSWSFCGLTLIATGLRTYTTVFITPRPRIDLWIMLVALALACVSQCFTHRAVINGIGQTIGRVAVIDAMQASLDMMIAVCTGQISLIIGKWSAALLIFQIQGRTMARAKWILYVTLTLNALTGVTASIFMWLSCERIPDQWQTNVVSNTSCTRFWIGTKVLCTCWAMSAFTDITLAVYPAFIFLPLKMSLKQRIGLCALFSGGLAAASLAISRILKTVAIGRMSFVADYTVEAAEAIRWAILEMWLVLLLTNIPSLRPLFAHVHNKFSSKSSLLLARLSKSIRKSTRSRNGGSGAKGSPQPSDIEAQRPGKKIPFLTIGLMTTLSMSTANMFGGTRTAARSAYDAHAMTKPSSGGTQMDSLTPTSDHSRSHSESTKTGYSHLEKKSDNGICLTSDDSRLVNNNSGELVTVPLRSLQFPHSARWCSVAAYPTQGQQDMGHRLDVGVIAVEHEVRVNASLRRSSLQVESRLEVRGHCSGQTQQRSCSLG